MKKKDIEELAELLEFAGYQGAMELITNELIPLARKKHISLKKAAEQYADGTKEQDTSHFQLWLAFTKINEFSPYFVFDLRSTPSP